jgi:type I restriction enzyme, S subunit
MKDKIMGKPMDNEQLTNDNYQLSTVTYQLPKGYKNTEIGIIPKEWEVDKIENVCSITTGNKNTQDRIDGAKYPFFVRSQTIERINTYSFDGEAVLTAGDGIGTGKIFHYINDKFDFHQRVYKMSHYKENMDGYFFYLYFSNHFHNRIMQMTAKSSVDSVRREMIADMKIPLPPLPEQTAIATVLSDTDSLIQALEKKIAKKQLIKKGAMQELLTPKEGWVVVGFDEAFHFLSTASYSRAEVSKDANIKYVHYGDIHTKLDRFLDFKSFELPTVKEEQLKTYSLIKEGDLIMADASEDYEGIGKSVEVKNIGDTKAISGLHTYLLRGKEGVFTNGFKAYLHSNKFIKNQYDRLATGLKVYGVSKANLKQVQIPLPPIKEQTRIAQILSDMDSEIQILQKKLAKYKQLKQGLMQSLLTGKIRLV